MPVIKTVIVPGFPWITVGIKKKKRAIAAQERKLLKAQVWEVSGIGSFNHHELMRVFEVEYTYLRGVINEYSLTGVLPSFWDRILWLYARDKMTANLCRYKKPLFSCTVSHLCKKHFLTHAELGVMLGVGVSQVDCWSSRKSIPRLPEIVIRRLYQSPVLVGGLLLDCCEYRKEYEGNQGKLIMIRQKLNWKSAL